MPTPVQAIAALNQIEQAQKSGSQLDVELGFKALELQFKKASFDQDVKHNNEMSRLRDDIMDKKTKLEKAVKDNVLRRKVEDAMAKGDFVLANRYQAMLSGDQLPDKIQAADYYRAGGFGSQKERTDTRELLGGTRTHLDETMAAGEQGFISPEEAKTGVRRDLTGATDNEKDIELIRALVNDPNFDFNKQDAQEVIQHIFGASSGRAPSATQERLNEIDRQVSNGVLTPEQGNQMKQRIVAGSPDAQSATQEKLAEIDRQLANGQITPAEAARLKQRIVAGNPPSGKDEPASVAIANLPPQAQSAFNNVSVGDTSQTEGANKARLRTAYDADVADGDTNFSQTKNILRGLALERTNESERKWVVGRDEMVLGLNRISELLDGYVSNGGDTGLLEGTWEQVLQNLGKTSNPAAAQVITELRAVIQAYRQSISGAAFTESEAKEYERLFPGLSADMTVNKARINGLSNQTKLKQKAFYERYLGKESAAWVEGDTQAVATPPTPRTLQPNQIQGMIEDARLNNVSLEDMLRALRAQGYDTIEFERIWGQQ